jgi:hypothetical protein
VPRLAQEGVAFAQATVGGMADEAPIWRGGFNSYAIAVGAGRLTLRPGFWLAIDETADLDYTKLRLDDVGGRIGVVGPEGPVDLNYLVLAVEMEGERRHAWRDPPQGSLAVRRAGAAVLCLLVAGAARGETWRPLAGGATDVAVGADGTLWAIGTDPAPGGKSILRWNGQAWETIPGGSRAHRRGSEGRGLGDQRRARHPPLDRYRLGKVLPAAPTTSGIGADGTVWVIGGGGTPYRWTGSEWDGDRRRRQGDRRGPERDSPGS